MTSSLDANPLSIAITDALAVLDNTTLAEEAVLRQLQVRLSFAAAAAEDEINMLAVEGLQQTLDEAIADTVPEHRTFLLAELKETLGAYGLQLQLDALKEPEE